MYIWGFAIMFDLYETEIKKQTFQFGDKIKKLNKH